MSINDSNASSWDDVTSRFYDNRPFPKDVEPECMLPADHHEKMKDQIYDPVNQPEHYRVGEVEAIDYISQQLGSGVKDYLLGNHMKYIHRHRFKGNAVEDLEKAEWYLRRLIIEERQGG
jgi:hypothetical protein